MKEIKDKARELIEAEISNMTDDEFFDLYYSRENMDTNELSYKLCVFCDKELGFEDAFLRDVPNPTRNQYDIWENSVQEMCDDIIEDVMNDMDEFIENESHERQDRAELLADPYRYYGVRKSDFY